ncbi:MAG: hypothetical protein O7D95_06165 [Betaproteobacteria bacterium]|nr:hypothetical protein [Betaproteobacteria bacterium]
MYRIYYSDGSFTENTDNLKTTDCQFVAEIRKDGRKFVHMGGHYYHYKNSVWRNSAASRIDGDEQLEGNIMDNNAFESLKRTVFDWLISA